MIDSNSTSYPFYDPRFTPLAAPITPVGSYYMVIPTVVGKHGNMLVEVQVPRDVTTTRTEPVRKVDKT